MRKSWLVSPVRRRRLVKLAVWLAGVAGLVSCGDAPIYTRAIDRGAPGDGSGGARAIGDGTGGGPATGGHGILATGGAPGGVGGTSGSFDPGAAAGAGGGGADGGVDPAAAGGRAGSDAAAGAAGIGDAGSGAGGAGDAGGAGGRMRQGGFTGSGGRPSTDGPAGGGGKGGMAGAGGTAGAAGAGGGPATTTPDGQGGAAGRAGAGGAGGGGGSRAGAGSGGRGPFTDPSKIGFESSSQGWYAAAGGLSNVGRRTTRAYAGVASLGFTLQYTGGAPVTNTLAVDSVAPATAPGPRSVVTFHIYLPATASAIEWVQPFIQDTNLTYASAFTSRVALTLGAWNTIKVTVPSNAVPTLHALGDELRTSGDTALNDDLFIDAIDW